MSGGKISSGPDSKLRTRVLSHPPSVLTQPPLWTPEADGIPAIETNKPFIKEVQVGLCIQLQF